VENDSYYDKKKYLDAIDAADISSKVIETAEE
jgi:hypothetical protein